MMDNAILVALSRQSALRRQMDIVANNLANMETGGFKASNVKFEEYLMPVAEASATAPADRDISFVMDTATMVDFSEGPMQRTGNPLDVAVDGPGWFVVDTAEGERYTRNGSFHIDNTGQLVTNAGDPVLGDGGAILFSEEDGAVTIAADGTISTEAGDKGRIRVVAFENEAVLYNSGDNLFKADGQPEDAEGAIVRQGMLEGSNVRPIVEMTRMIEVTRAYTSLSSMLERINDLRTDAIGALARVQ